MTARQKYKSIYWAWKSMKQRTLNPKCSAYRNYGARGIGVCDEWMTFEPFLDWALNNGWEKGKDIDRIDNDGDYTPENCRWTDRRTNTNNRRRTVRVTVDGVTRPVSEWAEISKIPHGSLLIWCNSKGHDYVAQRIKDAIEHGYKPCDYDYNHKHTPVINLTTGKKYKSIKAAARDVGMNSGALYNAIKHGKNTNKGLDKWEEVTE